MGCGSKRGHFKRVKNGFESIGLWAESSWVWLTHIFHMIFKKKKNYYKENNMYLPFGKSCNKLFDVKCISLNSPHISRINSVKLINTYSIIFKIIQILTLLSKTK